MTPAELEALERLLRQTYQDAHRRDVWQQVAGVAARFFTHKYAPLVEAYHEIAEGQDHAHVQGEDGRAVPGVAGEVLARHGLPGGR